MYKSCQDQITFYLQQFHNFIHQKYCLTCKHHFIYENAKYCPICGGKSLVWGNPRNTTIFDFIQNEGIVEKMIYPKWQLNKNSKAIICPRCGNEEIHPQGDYCKICGTYLINQCLGKWKDNGYDDPWFDTEAGCGALVDGDTRYCCLCGAETTFYHNKLLQDWKTECKNINTEPPKKQKANLSVLG